MPGAPERPDDADDYEAAYRDAGRVPGSVADYRHRLEVRLRDVLADLGVTERPAATERPEHGGHPDEAMGPVAAWPLPHGADGRMPAVGIDRLERAHDGQIGWIGALRASPMLQDLAIAAVGPLLLGVVVLGGGIGLLTGTGVASASVGSGILALVGASLLFAVGGTAGSRLVCALGASIREDAADGTEAERLWRCGACRHADRAWADGERDVTPTPVGEWDVPSRVRGVGSELSTSSAATADVSVTTDAAASPPNSSDETVADGGETPVGFAAAVGPDRPDDADEGADGGESE